MAEEKKSAVTSLKPPTSGFTKTERKWLEEVVMAIKTVRPIAGKNITVDEKNEQGTTINCE